MLAPSVVEEVRRLLAEDTLSHRKICPAHRREPGDDRGDCRGQAARLSAASPRPPGRSAGACRAAGALSGLRRHGLSALPLLPRPKPGGAATTSRCPAVQRAARRVAYPAVERRTPVALRGDPRSQAFAPAKNHENNAEVGSRNSEGPHKRRPCRCPNSEFRIPNLPRS